MRSDVKGTLRSLSEQRAKLFDSTLLHNLVYETVQGHHHREPELPRLLTLIEEMYEYSHERRTEKGDNDLASVAFGAAEDLNEHVDAVVEEAVAEALVDWLYSAEQYIDTWDKSDVTEAKREARAWLDENAEAVERAGLDH